MTSATTRRPGATFRTPNIEWQARLQGAPLASFHREMSLWHSIERALGYAASSLEAGFGFLQFFTHPNRQTVHDRIAETIVVVSRKNPGKR